MSKIAISLTVNGEPRQCWPSRASSLPICCAAG